MATHRRMRDAPNTLLDDEIQDDAALLDEMAYCADCGTGAVPQPPARDCPSCIAYAIL